MNREERLPQHRLERTIARVFSRPPQDDVSAAIETLTPPAFRVLVAERLRALERDLAEVRSRSTGCCSSSRAPL